MPTRDDDRERRLATVHAAHDAPGRDPLSSDRSDLDLSTDRELGGDIATSDQIHPSLGDALADIEVLADGLMAAQSIVPAHESRGTIDDLPFGATGLPTASELGSVVSSGSVNRLGGSLLGRGITDLGGIPAMIPLFATTAQAQGGRGFILARIIIVKPGERIRIGPELGGIGSPAKPPSGKPPKTGPINTPQKLKDRFAELALWVNDFLSSVWSYFDFFCTFTSDGEVVAKDVKITDAFSQKTEDKPGAKKIAGVTPKHVSAGLNQADLQGALNENEQGDDESEEGEGEEGETTIEEGDADDKREDVFWNNLEDIEVKRKPGKAGKPPGPAKGDTPEQKKKKEEIKKAVEKIKPGKLDATVKVKPKPKPK